jgi:hypothetical protein
LFWPPSISTIGPCIHRDRTEEKKRHQFGDIVRLAETRHPKLTTVARPPARRLYHPWLHEIDVNSVEDALLGDGLRQGCETRSQQKRAKAGDPEFWRFRRRS